MTVTCESCGSRFRLNEALLANAKAVRFRCRRCGGFIMVRNPEAPRLFPVSAVAPEAARVPQAVPGRIPSPLPVERMTAGSDISGMIRPVPARFPAGGRAALSAAKADPVPSAGAERKLSLLEEPLIPPSPISYGPNLFQNHAKRDIRKTRQASKDSSGRPLGSRLPLFVAVLGILLLAGGALYFGAMKVGQNLLGKGFPTWGSTNPGSASESPVFDIQNVKGYQNKQATGESLYVIQGTVANVGKSKSRGIRIQATLLGADNQAILKNEAFAGNLIDETLLPHMSRVRIEGFLGMRYGEGNVNRDIPPGKSLPFMVVFFDPPGGVESFTAKALDAE